MREELNANEILSPLHWQKATWANCGVQKRRSNQLGYVFVVGWETLIRGCVRQQPTEILPAQQRNSESQKIVGRVFAPAASNRAMRSSGIRFCDMKIPKIRPFRHQISDPPRDSRVWIFVEHMRKQLQIRKERGSWRCTRKFGFASPAWLFSHLGLGSRWFKLSPFSKVSSTYVSADFSVENIIQNW